MRPEKIEANERIRETQTALGMELLQPLPFLCECEDVMCRSIVRLAPSAYDVVRAVGNRWIVAAAHPHDGRVVSEEAGYMVVEG